MLTFYLNAIGALAATSANLYAVRFGDPLLRGLRAAVGALAGRDSNSSKLIRRHRHLVTVADLPRAVGADIHASNDMKFHTGAVAVREIKPGGRPVAHARI